jgi:GntR family transcriptional regulator
MLSRQQGKGTFVIASGIDFPIEGGPLEPGAKALPPGQGLEHRIIDYRTIKATGRLATLLRIPVGAPVLRVRRKTKYRGLNMGVGTLHVPSDVVPRVKREEFERGRFFDTLVSHRVAIARHRISIECVVFEEAVAKLVGVRSGLPAIGLTRLALDASSRPLAEVYVETRGDIGRYTLELGADAHSDHDGVVRLDHAGIEHETVGTDETLEGTAKARGPVRRE